jgi:hypothetical protein
MIKKLMVGLMVLGLLGCAQIPTQVDVKLGPEVTSQGELEFSYYTPAGPTSGATAQEIVSGFLAAGTGPQNDYAVARQFLSTDFAQRWKPDAGVLIRTGGPAFREAGSNLQIVNISVTARIDEHGRYLDPPGSESVSLRFQLVQEDGQWRISSAPNLTVVTPPVFSVVFRPFNLFFLDQQQRSLVADLRWFPSRASTGTRLVNALLDGPSSWLEPAVVTAIPEGTKLTIDAVRIEAGAAQVDFDSKALGADAIGRRLMLSQLRATLTQLPGVIDVAVLVNSSPQDITPAALTPASSGSDGLALSDAVYRLGSAQSQPLPGTQNLTTRYKPVLLASNPAANRIAFAHEEGIVLLTGSGLSVRTDPISSQREIADIDFDSTGLLWVVPKQSGSEIQVIDSEGETRTLVLPALGTRVRAQLSPEGTRLAVLMTQNEMSRLEIFTLVRDPRGWPTIINQGLTLDLAIGNPLAFSWQSQVSVRVAERTLSGLTSLSEYPLSGPRVQLPMPPAIALKLVPGPTSQVSYLLSDQGDVWVLSGGSWRRISSGVIDISAVR